MKIIDADKLHYVKVLIQSKDWTVKDAVVVFAKEIDKAPVVDTVRHGHWTIVKDGFGIRYWECSVCNGSGIGDYYYCPTCGAKMDEDGDTECNSR